MTNPDVDTDDLDPPELLGELLEEIVESLGLDAEVEIADGVRVRQMRSMVSEVRAKGEPVKEEASG